MTPMKHLCSLPYDIRFRWLITLLAFVGIVVMWMTYAHYYEEVWRMWYKTVQEEQEILKQKLQEEEESRDKESALDWIINDLEDTVEQTELGCGIQLEILQEKNEQLILNNTALAENLNKITEELSKLKNKY